VLFFNKGNVLYGRLCPYLNKVWSTDRDGVCSTEFHVLRIKPSDPPIHSDYLAAALRSSLVVAQTKHMMTGNTHPRLANDDVVDLLVPIPDEATQTEIVEAFCDLIELGELLFGDDWRREIEVNTKTDILCALFQLEKMTFSDPTIEPCINELLESWPKQRKRTPEDIQERHAVRGMSNGKLFRIE